MYPVKIVSLIAIAFVSLVVNAAPMPMAVKPNHVQAGAVFTAMPAHFYPPHVCLSMNTSFIEMQLTCNFSVGGAYFH